MTVSQQGMDSELTLKTIDRDSPANARMRVDTGIATNSFYGLNGEAEHFIVVQVPQSLGFREQVALLYARYARARKSLGLAADTAVFRRVFVSDVLNQAALIRESGFAGDGVEGPVALSIVQQPPLPGAKVALLAHHIESREPFEKRRLSKHHLLVTKNGARHLWSTGLCAGADNQPVSAATQTRGVFRDLIGVLTHEGGRLCDNCVRTWIYLKDVDVFYQAMVDTRRELFVEYGLNKDTHWIASTGIEGACAHQCDLVAMDAYSVLDLAPSQVSYLKDLDRLCSTGDYSVTFERGTRVAYADRCHHFISGTASIDRAGRVVHPGDVLGQLEHALGNVQALLQAGSASFSDMMYLVVYLRDPTDFAAVRDYLAHRHPDLPAIVVQGAVCRPQWLVEVEGVAVTPNDQPALPAF